jgi:ankyrin repeat protein
MPEAQFDMPRQDSNGHTAFFVASKFGRFKVMQVLLSRRATDVDTNDRYNASLLFAATRNGHEEAVCVLLSHGTVSLDSMDASGRTIHFWAGRTNNPRLVVLINRYTGIASALNDADDNRMNSGSALLRDTAGWCDVCTLDVRSDCEYYKCAVCDRGDFLICLECFKFGM